MNATYERKDLQATMRTYAPVTPINPVYQDIELTNVPKFCHGISTSISVILKERNISGRIRTRLKLVKSKLEEISILDTTDPAYKLRLMALLFVCYGKITKCEKLPLFNENTREHLAAYASHLMRYALKTKEALEAEIDTTPDYVEEEVEDELNG